MKPFPFFISVFSLATAAVLTGGCSSAQLSPERIKNNAIGYCLEHHCRDANKVVSDQFARSLAQGNPVCLVHLPGSTWLPEEVRAHLRGHRVEIIFFGRKRGYIEHILRQYSDAGALGTDRIYQISDFHPMLSPYDRICPNSRVFELRAGELRRSLSAPPMETDAQRTLAEGTYVAIVH